MSEPAALGLAVLAVAALIGLCAMMGFASTARLSGPDEAAALADSLGGGFAARDVVLDRERHGALLADTASRLALVAPVGSHFLVRLIGPGWTASDLGQGRIALGGGDVAALLDLGSEAPAWLAAIEAASRAGKGTAA